MNRSPPLGVRVGVLEGVLPGDFFGVFDGVFFMAMASLCFGVFGIPEELALNEADIFPFDKFKLELIPPLGSRVFFCHLGTGPLVIGSSMRTALLRSFKNEN